MFQCKILQCPAHFVLLRQQQDVIIQLEGIEHTEIDSDGHDAIVPT